MQGGRVQQKRWGRPAQLPSPWWQTLPAVFSLLLPAAPGQMGWPWAVFSCCFHRQSPFCTYCDYSSGAQPAPSPAHYKSPQPVTIVLIKGVKWTFCFCAACFFCGFVALAHRSCLAIKCNHQLKVSSGGALMEHPLLPLEILQRFNRGATSSPGQPRCGCLAGCRCTGALAEHWLRLSGWFSSAGSGASSSRGSRTVIRGQCTRALVVQAHFLGEDRPEPPASRFKHVHGCTCLLAQEGLWLSQEWLAARHLSEGMESGCSPSRQGVRVWGQKRKSHPLELCALGPPAFSSSEMYGGGSVAQICLAALTQAAAPLAGQWVKGVVGSASLTNSRHGLARGAGKAQNLFCQGTAASQEGHAASWTWMGSVDVDFGGWVLWFRHNVKKVSMVQRYK